MQPRLALRPCCSSDGWRYDPVVTHSDSASRRPIGLVDSRENAARPSLDRYGRLRSRSRIGLVYLGTVSNGRRRTVAHRNSGTLDSALGYQPTSGSGRPESRTRALDSLSRAGGSDLLLD